MPYEAIKLPKSTFYKVRNIKSGEVSAKKTTKDKAERQLRLLRGIEAGTLKSRK
jgi:hypothetical protein